jgi:hypothetical protein
MTADKRKVVAALHCPPSEFSSLVIGIDRSELLETIDALASLACQVTLVAAYLERRRAGAFSDREAQRYAERLVRQLRRLMGYTVP